MGRGEKGVVFVCVCVCVCVCVFKENVFFLHFLDYLFCYTFETNLRFIYYILTTSENMLFVVLFNGFRPWTNVGTISVLDVVGDLGVASIFVLENL